LPPLCMLRLYLAQSCLIFHFRPVPKTHRVNRTI
jgi:hypothetical protein